MKKNVGPQDRIIRLLLALITGMAGIYFNSWFGLLALIPMMTALISFCPLYKIIGFTTGTTKKVQ